jgi:hypothetical protein
MAGAAHIECSATQESAPNGHGSRARRPRTPEPSWWDRVGAGGHPRRLGEFSTGNCGSAGACAAVQAEVGEREDLKLLTDYVARRQLACQ